MADTPDIENPFDQGDFDRLEAAIAETHKIDRAIKKATAAGVEMGDAAKTNKENRDRLLKLKNAYKPGM